ncbi:MAG: acetyl-CoA carboxylase biotin carboxylase subunit [Thaumarchaeota archaeon]|nr:acetyl-CoA carboxylase biotin carboxylase subunit [Nitrososphaerota archaeon]MCS4540583.1 acetyl-CoA carboxylase biotin carboxylase subunit [Nitrososphaerota archaeon]
MFKKILIANRGEIAVRVIRTCKLLGIKTVAIYSDADNDALHVKLADQAFRIGPPQPGESYLNVERMMRVAEESGVDAVHPGYGFISENWNFAAACEESGIKFVGPSSRTLSITGNKVDCKRIARKEGVPVIPGIEDVIDDAAEAERVANEMGYPVMLKSAFGGGGRGIREAKNRQDLRENFERALSEARGAFGRAGMYIEKLVRPARHVEFQILSDGKGKTIHLGERECSIQRRHQKLLELTPSPMVEEDTRKRVGEFAITVARSVDYENAGTVEFLTDGVGNFYFTEVNPRLQVEHPVTEFVTGMDLVEQQLAIASGESMAYSQGSVVPRGAAMQCRVNAEDPTAGFAPSVGTVESLVLPTGPGVRVDTALYEGCHIPEYYDSLIAKLITWGRDLEEARRRMLPALEEFHIGGLKTTIPLHKELVAHSDFRAWNLDTDFLERNFVVETLVERVEKERHRLLKEGVAIAAAIMVQGMGKKVRLESRHELRVASAESKVGGARFYDAL